MKKNLTFSGPVQVFSTRALFGAGVLASLFALAAPEPASAQLEPEQGEVGDPYVGAFSGSVAGDNGTSGAIRVEISADPADPAALLASVSIGDGLEADLGRLCGKHDVPALEKMVTFTRNEDGSVFGETTWPLGRLTLNVDISANLLEDGDTISALIEVDTPAICPDVAMMASLIREVSTATTAQEAVE